VGVDDVAPGSEVVAVPIPVSVVVVDSVASPPPLQAVRSAVSNGEQAEFRQFHLFSVSSVCLNL
jgi:hypothetical protein